MTMTMTINPDYTLYICRFNAMYHDYNMSEADIVAMLGAEPPKHVTAQEPAENAASAQFDAANESPAPYDESMWDNYRRQRAAGFVDDDAYSGRELVDQEPSSGWGL